ncbi:MAG: fatty acid desaturase [Gammaproteobacteria bacterium]|nr:fatty acid desaturase [Gammaproteobacteria bacterium]
MIPLFSFSWPVLLLITLLLTHVTIISVTVFLHRHQAHRALELHPLVSHLFRFWLWLTTGMVTKEWVAIHRKHHVHCETEKDPHSPQVEGVWRVLFGGVLFYRREAHKPETLQRFGSGTPDDWLERHLYTGRNYWGVVVLLGLDLVLFGWPGSLIWLAQVLWIPFWAAGVVNGAAHFWGYRNFEIPDASTNLWPWGLIIGGEELHNNHHTYPQSARLSNKPWELDIGWAYIRLFQAMGLARVRRVAPRLRVESPRNRVDMDNLRAVISNRFQLMSDYASQVLGQVCGEQLSRADIGREDRRQLKRARRLIARDAARLTPAAEARLQVVLVDNRELRTIYEFKQRLQQLWTRSEGQGGDWGLTALQEWCAQAEKTGIAALADFAERLRGCVPEPHPA